MTKHCPACGEETVSAYGETDSEILFIGSIPDEDELKYKRMFTGPTSHIFKKELFKHARIDLLSTRQVPLWFHAKGKNPDCLKVSMSLVNEEMKGKKFVILVGAEAVNMLAGVSIDNCNGLDVTDEVRLCADIDEGDGLQISEDMKFFALCSPKTVFRSLGEFRFGLQQLGKWIKES